MQEFCIQTRGFSFPLDLPFEIKAANSQSNSHSNRSSRALHLREGRGRAEGDWMGQRRRALPPSIDVPDKLWGVPVVAVNDSAFSGCNESKSVSLSRFLEKVGREAFADCGANADAGFVLTVPSGANLSEGSFSGTNVEIVFW